MSQESPHNSNPTGRINPLPQSTPPSTPEDKDREKKFERMQGSYMVLAVLAAGATFQSVLSPPGGLWQENDEHGHIAGTPVLRDTSSRCYTAFFYCNSTAFFMSLTAIIMLMHPQLSTNYGMISALKITIMIDIVAFMVAYVAGSCRELSSSIYLFIMMGGVFTYMIRFTQQHRIYRLCCMKHTPVKEEP